ncbi:hypothetical protein [Flavihumibacter solisilvae]|nr:hypothetical protein [Flavihumibacter solisilvae]
MISLGNNRFKSQGKGNYSTGYEFIPRDDGEIKSLVLGQLMWEKRP